MDGLNLELLITAIKNELQSVTKEYDSVRGEKLEACFETDMERLKWVLEMIDEIKA